MGNQVQVSHGPIWNTWHDKISASSWKMGIGSRYHLACESLVLQDLLDIRVLCNDVISQLFELFFLILISKVVGQSQAGPYR